MRPGLSSCFQCCAGGIARRRHSDLGFTHFMSSWLGRFWAVLAPCWLVSLRPVARGPSRSGRLELRTVRTAGRNLADSARRLRAAGRRAGCAAPGIVPADLNQQAPGGCRDAGLSRLLTPYQGPCSSRMRAAAFLPGTRAVCSRYLAGPSARTVGCRDPSHAPGADPGRAGAGKRPRTAARCARPATACTS